MAPVDVVVVGGGIAGLSAAYELSRRGLSFVVLESAPRPGGVIFSEQIDGFTIDAGPDSLLIQKPEAIKLCDDIGLADRLVSTKPPRIAYVQRAGRLHPLPAASVLGIPTRIGPFLRTGLFSWAGKLRMGAEVFVPPRRENDDESIGAFIRRRFGREAVDYLAEPLLAGIHAGDVDRLSMQSLFPRFVELERRYGSVLRGLRDRGRNESLPTNHLDAPNPQSPIPNPDGAFRSLKGGLGEMVCALVKAIGSERVRTNERVETIDGRGPFEVRTSSGATIVARSAILAAPAYATASLLRSRDEAVARLCDEVPYASVATVALAYRRRSVAHPLDGSGFVVPRTERSGIMAASWLSSKWPNRAPDDCVLLRTFLGGMRDPHALDRSDADLIAVSATALGRVLRIGGQPLLTRVYRWVRANAQHEVGHRARVAAIERALSAYPGLFVTGSGFRGVGIPDCIADGRATARIAGEWLRNNSDRTPTTQAAAPATEAAAPAAMPSEGTGS